MLDCVVQRAEVEEGNLISCSRNFPHTLTYNANKHVGWNYHHRLSDEVSRIQSLQTLPKVQLIRSALTGDTVSLRDWERPWNGKKNGEIIVVLWVVWGTCSCFIGSANMNPCALQRNLLWLRVQSPFPLFFLGPPYLVRCGPPLKQPKDTQLTHGPPWGLPPSISGLI